MLIADLHIHSRYSRACSKNLSIGKLEEGAKIKGISLLGTGDFTHPKWMAELKEKLFEDGSGILRTENGFPFMLSVEVSNIYSQDGKLRKVHMVILAKSFSVADQIIELLSPKGKIASDGRPIFGKYSCPEMVSDLKSIDKDIEIIPAHIWTPWFSLFGSMSGFDTVKDCFQEQTKHIHALETGLSSDPEMNWRLSQLDGYRLFSSSDSHSFWPWRLGREATLFDCPLTYDALLSALRSGKGYMGTIEVDPNYGKYHYDGHRKCDVCLKPADALKNKNICPVCKKPLTIGVLHRVEELADRPEGFVPPHAGKHLKLLPLHEVIGAVLGKGIGTQSVTSAFNSLISAFGSELNIMLNTPKEELLPYADGRVVNAIINVREQKAKVSPGYDGEYGKVMF
ncbi:MAG: endonuclease Q family protein [Nanoarchaeota archaeon]